MKKTKDFFVQKIKNLINFNRRREEVDLLLRGKILIDSNKKKISFKVSL